MDDKLHIIQHLYGEADAASDRGRLLKEEALRKEYETLSGVKFHLDQRPKQRPDAAVLDTIFAAAASASGQPALAARQDRKPQPRNAARRFGLVGMVSTMIAVLMVAGIGLYQLQQEGAVFAPSGESALSEETEAMTDQAPSLAEQKSSETSDADASPQVASAEPALPREQRIEGEASAPLGRSRAMPQPAAPMDLSAPASGGMMAVKTEADAVLADDAEAEESVPAWDAADEVLRVRRQLEMVETRSPEFAWGDSAVMSLDVLPANPRGRDMVTPASTRRGNH